MRPFETEVPGLEKVGTSTLAGLVIRNVHGEVAVAFVIDLVSGVYVNRPRAQSINVSCNGEIQVITENKVHSKISQIKSSRILLSESWHQQSCRPARSLRNESERKTDRQRHVLDYRVCRAEHCLLGRLRDDLGRRQCQIIMRVFEIADGILSFGYIDGPVRQHLNVLSMQESLFLLRYHVGNAGLTGVEVIPQFLHGVCGIAFFHGRLSLDLTCQRIQCSTGIDGTCIQVIFHVIRAQLHIVILHGNVTVVVDLALSVSKYFDYGVLRRRESRTGQ